MSYEKNLLYIFDLFFYAKSPCTWLYHRLRDTLYNLCYVPCNTCISYLALPGITDENKALNYIVLYGRLCASG